MGFRSPQETQKVALRQEATTRFQGAVAPKIDTQYIDSFSKRLAERQQEQLQFVKYGIANEGDKERVKAQASVANSEGPAALLESQAQRTQLERALNKKLELIPEHLRPDASMEVQKTLNQYDSFAIPYSYSQVKKSQDEVIKTRIANDMNNIAEVSGNPDAVNAGFETLTETITARAMKPYRDLPMDTDLGNGMTVGDMVNSEVRTGQSKSLAKAIESQLGAGQMPIAKTLLQNHNDKLLPTDRNKILKAFKKAEEKQQTRTPLDLVEYAKAEAGDDLTAADEILFRLAPDTKTYKDSVKILRSRYKLVQEEVDLRDYKIVDQLTQNIYKGQYPTADQLNQISGYERRQSFINAVNRSQGSLGVITNQQVKEDLLNRLSNATPEEAAKINLPAHKLYLGPSDYSMLEKLQTDLFKKDASGRLKASQSDFKQVRGMIKILAQEKKITSKKQFQELESLAMHEYERVRDTNPNYQISDIKKSVYNRIQREGFMTEKGFWSDTTKIAKSVDPLQGKQVHTSWRNMIRTKYKDHSEDEQNKLMIKLIDTYGEEAIAKPFPLPPK
jgi:hypothetical protein